MSSPHVSAHFWFMGLEVDTLSVPFLKNLHQFQMITHVVASFPAHVVVLFPQGTSKLPEYCWWSVSQVRSLCTVEDFKTWGFHHTTDFGQGEGIPFTTRHYKLCKGCRLITVNWTIINYTWRTGSLINFGSVTQFILIWLPEWIS